MIQAKAHSDEKRYVDKNRLIAQAMRRDPAAFIIDSDDGKGIVGITHVPTGFQIHMLKNQVAPGVQVIEKQANRFAQLWRAGKLSGDAVQRATGVSRAAANPRSASGVNGILQSMRRQRGDVGALGKWMPAQETYSRLLPKEVARRTAAMRGAPADTFDFGALSPGPTRPGWLGGPRTIPKRPQQVSTASGPAKRRAGHEKVDDILHPAWEPQVTGINYYRTGPNLMRAPLGTATARHELGHWGMEKLRLQNPVGAALETRKMLRALEQQDPRLMAAVVSKAAPGYTARDRWMLLQELQGHALAARGGGVGAVRLRAATALDNPTMSRSTLYRKFPKVPSAWRSWYLKNRQNADAQLGEVRRLMKGVPAETGLPSAMEHLTRNYAMELPNALPAGMIRPRLPA